MPGEHLTGFFGKMPAAGDFVGRGLPAAYVRFWDRWVARHLASPLSAEPLEAHPMLRFVLGPACCGPMAGVVMASMDSAGRCFPLSVAAAPPASVTGLAAAAARWFDEIEEAGDAARCGELGVDELEQRLAALPFPTDTAMPVIAGQAITGMAFWTDGAPLHTVDPDTPDEALRRLLVSHGEAG